MNNISSNKFFIWSITLISLIIAMAGSYHVYHKAGLPLPLSDVGYITINESGLDKFGEKYHSGDTILFINKFKIESLDELEIITDGLKIGDIIDITIKNGDTEKILKIELVPFYSLQYIIIMILSGLLYFSIGIVVYLKKKNHSAAIIYYWASIAVGLIITTTWGNYNIYPVGLGYLLRIIFLLMYCISPVLYFHFSVLFPAKKNGFYVHLLKYLYPIALLLGLLSSIGFMLTAAINFDNRYLFINIFNINRIFFILCIVLSVASFVSSFRFADEEYERRMLRWVFLGLSIAAVGFIGLWQIPQMFFGKGLLEEEYVLLITWFAPVSFSIALLKYHILDIDLIFRRSTIYSILVLVIISFYGLIVLLAQFILSRITFVSSFYILAISSLSLAFFLEPTKRVTQKFVDKKFFRVQYDYKIALKEIIEGFKYQSDPEQIADYLCARLGNLLLLKNVGVILFDNNGAESPLIKFYNYSNTHYNNLFRDLSGCKDKIVKAEAAKYSIEPGIEISHNLDAYIIQPAIAILFPVITNESRTSGLLVIGDKLSGKRFSHEDIFLVSSIALETAHVIDNYLLRKKIILESKEASRLRELNDIKSYFVSSVSHELKTPLTSIKIFIELIKENPDISKPVLYDYLTTIECETNRLTKLIDNVLDYSKIEKGIKEYNFSKTDLNAITSNTISFMAQQIKLYNFSITYIEEPGPLFIFADLDSVKRSIMNLIENAMKYSSSEYPIVLRTFRKDEYFGLCIEDKGMGIHKEDLHEIFKPFYRSKKVTMNSISGAGIGLSIVKEVMNAHNGQVHVESEINVGSKFSLLFPGID